MKNKTMRAFITHSFLFLFFYQKEAQGQYFTALEVPGYSSLGINPNIGVNSQGVIYCELSIDTLFKNLLISINFGESWQPVQCPQLNSAQATIVFAANDKIYSYDYEGDTYVSADNGDNWTLVNTTTQVISISFASKTGILVGEKGNKIYVSLDDGASWSQRTIPISTSTFNVYDDGFSDDIYFFYQNELYRSTDFGVSWTLIFNNSQNLPQFDNIYAVFVNPYNGAIYMTPSNTSNYYASFDNGSTWEEQPFIPGSGSLPFSDTGKIYKPGGYYSNDNGQTWIQLNNGASPGFSRIYVVPNADCEKTPQPDSSHKSASCSSA